MSHKRKVLQGSASNLVRVLLSMLVSMVLPPFLVHRMPPAEYSAWVLILQLSAYVGLLDFGLQAAIGKYVAEYDASGEREASHHLISTSFTILALAAGIACLAIGAMVWGVPRLFHQMPATLVPEVRIALLAVGLSSAVALPFGTFLATFTGLQEYFFPTIIATISRVGSAALLIVLLLLHCSLVQLALVMAGFNLATAATQFFGWRRFLRGRVNFSFLLFHRRSATQLAKYGSVISIWSLAMFFVSGLDTVIVGHYQYKDTGFYAIATGAANFMLTVVASVFGPLVPAVSSMQSGSTPGRIGDLCTKIARYCTLLLCLLGLPLVFGAYPLLSLWVGKKYATQSALYLEVLSIWLVQRIGAVGVAIGTLVGAFVSVGLHLLVSMPLTQSTIRLQRSRFLMQGMLRPLLIIAPSLLFYPFWRRLNMVPAEPAVLAIWIVVTAAMAWWVVLTEEDRRELGATLLRAFYWRTERT